ncbi:hypothetical protein ACLK17_14765 [Escherichia coli]
MVNILNSRQIHWNNTGLDMGYGAAWGRFDGNQETLQPLLGQLSWLAERSCAHHHVLALDSREEMVSGQTTKQVLLLNTIRTALIRVICCSTPSQLATKRVKVMMRSSRD